MGLKQWLMPAISARLLSRERLLRRRASAEAARRRAGQPHLLHYFHQVDDPYSTLAAACLPELLARYDVALQAHVVGPPPDSAAPERERLVAYSRRDAQLLARRWGLDFNDPGQQPTPQRMALTTALLVSAAQQGLFVELAGPLSVALWRGTSLELPLTPAAPEIVQRHLAESDALRQRLGHYLGATFFYAGEWYWGLDRLHHLERRLQALGAGRGEVRGPLFPPDADLSDAVALDAPPPIDFFFSLRSPYSAIVAPRVFELGRLTGAPVRLRYLLPMVMRGLPVPKTKRSYIAADAAREAFERSIPFGRLNDPVGRPTERGLALIPHAENQGLGQRYVLAFMHAVWAQGVDAGSERGLRRIVETAGLSWDGARAALQDETWRASAERNREALFALGLWGVPSFQVGSLAVWGQDRLGLVQQALLAPAKGVR
ncbi:2-hydroxychromene-2-carboxylate isomerase [Roseateles toxinivorans]|uniref:2-hydroxychromene-2-carboxylate isomerase n=2 Tax=Roseateles toxinivorans TaxID=270368 RepID=A0A4R6QJB2_9BURK|nr:2-hydroxychromene-2-carboxylate isomerase [Roseateles toxinivorans]